MLFTLSKLLLSFCFYACLDHLLGLSLNGLGSTSRIISAFLDWRSRIRLRVQAEGDGTHAWHELDLLEIVLGRGRNVLEGILRVELARELTLLVNLLLFLLLLLRLMVKLSMSLLNLWLMIDLDVLGRNLVRLLDHAMVSGHVRKLLLLDGVLGLLSSWRSSGSQWLLLLHSRLLRSCRRSITGTCRNDINRS